MRAPDCDDNLTRRHVRNAFLKFVFTSLCQHTSQLVLNTWASHSQHHSVQQLQNGTIATSVQPLAHTQEANGTASLGFVSSPLLPRSAISSQVPACPTRHVTIDVMPLADAITRSSHSLSSYSAAAS